MSTPLAVVDDLTSYCYRIRIPKNAKTSVDGTVGFAMMKKQPTKRSSKKTKVSAIY
jgi:hypothetical protein